MLIFNVDNNGIIRTNDTWAIIKSISNTNLTKLAEPIDIDGLNNRQLVIPVILIQQAVAYATGMIYFKTDGLYILSNKAYTYTEGTTYAINVLLGTKIY